MLFRSAHLFRTIATVALDVPVGVVDDWQWRGPHPDAGEVLQRYGAESLLERATKAWAKVQKREAPVE